MREREIEIYLFSYLVLIRFCHMLKEEHERHPMNQNILINHGMC